MSERWHPVLVRVSRVLEPVNALAHWTYRAGLRSTHRAAVPVISVGNIALGGTGKTPLVAALARTLLDAGARPAVLTRGYRRHAHRPALIQRRPEVSWEQVGDEPALLARALPELAIVVDADRVRGAATAVAQAGATHLLLDDGFQHWRLARDLDIVTLPADDPLCEHSPRREHPRALARADALVLTGVTLDLAAALVAGLAARCPGKAVIATHMRPIAVHRGDQRLPPSSLAGQRVVAAAGIARPEGFFATLRALDAEMAGTFPFPDHHAYRSHEVEGLLRAAEGRRALLVTTAKDAVKLPPAVLAQAAWVEIEAVCIVGSFAELLAPHL